MSANYGALSGTKFRQTIDESMDENGALTEQGKGKVKEIFNQILVKEIVKAYRFPNAVSLAHDI